MVALVVQDENELLAAQARLAGKGIRTVAFHEPDFDTGFSAIASEPIWSGQKRKAFYVYEKLGERRVPVMDGSKPSLPANTEVAQRLEQRSLKALIVGSSPRLGAMPG